MEPCCQLTFVKTCHAIATLSSIWSSGGGASDTACRKRQHPNGSAASNPTKNEKKTLHVNRKKEGDVKTPVSSYLSVAVHLHAVTGILQGADILAEYTLTALWFFCTAAPCRSGGAVATGAESWRANHHWKCNFENS